MMTKAVIVHQLPGRLRLRLAGKRGDSDYFSSVTTALQSAGTVHAVKANPSTGSLVVEFFGTAENLTEKLRECEVVIETQEEPAPVPRSGEPGTLLSRKRFNVVSGREINPMLMVGVLLTGVGLVQTIRGKVLVPSITGFWYAMQALRQSGGLGGAE